MPPEATCELGETYYNTQSRELWACSEAAQFVAVAQIGAPEPRPIAHDAAAYDFVLVLTLLIGIFIGLVLGHGIWGARAAGSDSKLMYNP